MELDKIKLNPNNPRFIKDEKFKSLVKSLIELPVMTTLREVVIDEDNVIIGGNMRYRAAKEAGWKEIPTKVFTRAMADENNKLTNQNKTYEQYCKEIMIKDNVSGGEWDWELLSSQFEKEELEEWGLDVDKWKDDEVVEDEVPEVTENPISKLGEVYQLGRHRLMCGDSTKIDEVEALMGGRKADMVFTDPPYNVSIGTIKHQKFKQREIENDAMSSEDFDEFCLGWATVIKKFCDGIIYCWGGQGEDGRLMFTVLDKMFHNSTTIIWAKDQFTLGRGKYHCQYEPCWFGWNKDGSSFTPDRTLSNLWNFDRPKNLTYIRQ